MRIPFLSLSGWVVLRKLFFPFRGTACAGRRRAAPGRPGRAGRRSRASCSPVPAPRPGASRRPPARRYARLPRAVPSARGARREPAGLRAAPRPGAYPRCVPSTCTSPPRSATRSSTRWPPLETSNLMSRGAAGAGGGSGSIRLAVRSGFGAGSAAGGWSAWPGARSGLVWTGSAPLPAEAASASGAGKLSGLRTRAAGTAWRSSTEGPSLSRCRTVSGVSTGSGPASLPGPAGAAEREAVGDGGLPGLLRRESGTLARRPAALRLKRNQIALKCEFGRAVRIGAGAPWPSPAGESVSVRQPGWIPARRRRRRDGPRGLDSGDTGLHGGRARRPLGFLGRRPPLRLGRANFRLDDGGGRAPSGRWGGRQGLPWLRQESGCARRTCESAPSGLFGRVPRSAGDAAGTGVPAAGSSGGTSCGSILAGRAGAGSAPAIREE